MLLKRLRWALTKPDALHGAAGYVRDVLGPTRHSLCIQAALYIGQALHLQRHGEPIFAADFRATFLGPVVPEIQFKLDRHGPIHPKHVQSLTPAQLDSLYEAAMAVRVRSRGNLVAFVLQEGGAWAAAYSRMPSTSTGPLTGPIISKEEMRSDYLLSGQGNRNHGGE